MPAWTAPDPFAQQKRDAALAPERGMALANLFIRGKESAQAQARFDRQMAQEDQQFAENLRLREAEQQQQDQQFDRRMDWQEAAPDRALEMLKGELGVRDEFQQRVLQREKTQRRANALEIKEHEKLDAREMAVRQDESLEASVPSIPDPMTGELLTEKAFALRQIEQARSQLTPREELDPKVMFGESTVDYGQMKGLPFSLPMKIGEDGTPDGLRNTNNDAIMKATMLQPLFESGELSLMDYYNKVWGDGKSAAAASGPSPEDQQKALDAEMKRVRDYRSAMTKQGEDGGEVVPSSDEILRQIKEDEAIARRRLGFEQPEAAADFSTRLGRLSETSQGVSEILEEFMRAQRGSATAARMKVSDEESGRIQTGLASKARETQAASQKKAKEMLPQIRKARKEAESLRDEAVERWDALMASEDVPAEQKAAATAEVKQLLEYLENAVPATPKTPAEAAKLPSGTVFIDGNGVIRRVPG